ncbi:unnamed protein product [Mesocestoides corti]|uniref:CDT1 domain-containing protein n=1 Tax=Mesocestoides corti TaxID=53468 RepID=A0A0R3UHK4_MESCO|nr:unnamed protein product [Mesocestoides corti]
MPRHRSRSPPPTQPPLPPQDTANDTVNSDAADIAHIDSVLQSPVAAVLNGSASDEYTSDDDAQTTPASSSSVAEALQLPPLPAPQLTASLFNSLRSTMTALLHEVVMATRGWSVSQLTALHCDIFHVTQRAKQALGPQFDTQALKTNLCSILQNHQQMVIYDRFDDTNDAPTLNPYSPTTYH